MCHSKYFLKIFTQGLLSLQVYHPPVRLNTLKCGKIVLKKAPILQIKLLASVSVPLKSIIIFQTVFPYFNLKMFKGKSSTKTSDALRELEDLAYFQQSISVSLGTSLHYLTDSWFV